MSDYNHKEIESKWQKKWEADGIYHATDTSGKPKYYALVEFPYPSGDGLHVGHPRPYIGMDIIARQKRMAGHNVLYPMGWDAFGLPSENYAIKTGIHPAIVTKQNSDNFRRQIQMLGISFDWSREINTTDPAYYKWTQWIFLQLFKKGLAYKAKTTINWCPSCKIGLANEEVVTRSTSSGQVAVCERCGTAVELKEKEQWLLKITEYAQRLYDDLDTVDYIERAKIQQRNWIGPSEGAEINFKIQNPKSKKEFTEVVFASNNLSKLKRMQNLFNAAGLGVTLKMPVDIGIKDYKVVEDAPTLQGNAEKKARTLATQTDLPVFADDSGFFIEGTELNPVTVKRNALNGEDEHSLTLEEICQRMRQYYMHLATARGGQVPAEWRSALCLITPDKQVKHFEVARPVTLTDQFRGEDDPHLPLRGLYIPKATGKYPVDYTPEDELKEMEPITQGIKELFSPGIKVFTTRPDTIFGVTYLAISPKLAVELTGKDFGVKAEAGRENKDKLGSDTGLKVINPANGAELPVWVANYVSSDYGTGAIMAVPAHDERDFEFAKKYNLPIKPVVAYPVMNADNPPRLGKTDTKREVIHAILRNPKDDTYLVAFLKGDAWGDKKPVNFVIGGVEEGEDFQESAAREIIEETGYTDFKLIEELPIEVSAKFFQAQKDVNRTAHIRTFVFELQSTTRNPVAAEEEAKHEFKWLSATEVTKALNIPTDQLVWDYYRRGGFAYANHGPLVNSGKFNGLNSEEAKKKITEFVGGEWKKTYKLRDWIFSRQRYWGEPIPLVYCQKDGWVAVPEDQLPVELPQVEKYQPTDTGESPLANITEWVETTCPTCGGPARRETDVMPNWAGSSWYYLAYTISENLKSQAPISKQIQSSEIQNKLKYWQPVDWYNGGMEHTVLHLLYSRFWHKFLFDLGVVPTSEPYAKRTSHGLILAEGGEKMSKSKGNVINPDSIVETYGADTLRLYEMFLGPFDQTAVWSTESIIGPRRFLEKVWKQSAKCQAQSAKEQVKSQKLQAVLHQTVKKISEDILAMRFNTAVSSLMVLLGVIEKEQVVSQDDWETFLKLLSPFAPHLTEELWSQLGYLDSIHLTSWPSFDPNLIVSASVKLIVQINGTVRDVIEVNQGLGEAEAKKVALVSPKIEKWLAGKVPVRVIYVSDKLINFVLKN